MGLTELGLDVLPLRHELFHFLFMAQVKGDCAVDLLQAQSWVMRSDRFRLFAVAILPNNAVNRHTTPDRVIPTVAVFNEIPCHGYNQFYFISPGRDHSATWRDELDLHVSRRRIIEDHLEIFGAIGLTRGLPQTTANRR